MMVGRGKAKNRVTRNMEGRGVTSFNPALSFWHPDRGGYIGKAVGKATLLSGKGDQFAINDQLIQGDKLVVTKGQTDSLIYY